MIGYSDPLPEVYTVTWAEHIEYKARGLTVIEVDSVPGRELVMTVQMPDDVRQELAARARAKRPGMLDVMVKLTAAAERERGKTRQVQLGGGLGIDVNYGIDGAWRLQIWREAEEPAPWEWRSVLAAWPGAPQDLQPKRIVSRGRVYLQAGWTNQLNERTNETDGTTD